MESGMKLSCVGTSRSAKMNVHVSRTVTIFAGRLGTNLQAAGLPGSVPRAGEPDGSSEKTREILLRQ